MFLLVQLINRVQFVFRGTEMSWGTAKVTVPTVFQQNTYRSAGKLPFSPTQTATDTLRDAANYKTHNYKEMSINDTLNW